MMYQLSSQLQGHEADVRALSCTSNGWIVSSSRDITCRVWTPLGDTNTSYETKKTLQGHSRYIIAVCVLPKEFANAIGTFAKSEMVATGSNDRMINLYALDTDETLLNPIAKFQGHNDAVCSLSYHNGKLLSSSWDKTCRIWSGLTQFTELSGHESTVWHTVGVPGTNNVITASGDRTLRLWDFNGVCRMRYEGHQDAVRRVQPLDGESFLSASNDGFIIHWNLHSAQQLRCYTGHESFIYSIHTLPDAENGFISVGEDKSLRVWKFDNSTSTQTIIHPAISVWAATVLPNGDIVTGSSDGVIRVFTRDPRRVASQDDLNLFNATVEETSKSVQVINPNELPGLEVLATPGKFDHENKMVNNAGVAEVHQWSETDWKWQKMGDALGSSVGGTGPSSSSASSASSSVKNSNENSSNMLDGEKFDQIIDVDIQEGAPPLKLGFNRTDDPWMVAQKFIFKHNLSQLFLDQIADFITKNRDDSVEIASSDFYSPFGTGYIPGSAPKRSQPDPLPTVSTYISVPPNVPIIRFSEFSSPPLHTYTLPSAGPSLRHLPSCLPNHFTKPARATPNNNLPLPRSVCNKYYPKQSFHLFSSKDPGKIMDKLKEYNSAMESYQQLKTEDVAHINSILTQNDTSGVQLSKLLVPLHWPIERSFIAIDIIRIALLLPGGNKFYAEEEGEDLIHLLLCTLPDHDEMNKFTWVYLYALNNLFAHRPGQYLMEQCFDQIFPKLILILSNNNNQKVVIGISTICLNFCIIASCVKNEEMVFQIYQILKDLILLKVNNDESQFRCLVAYGHLLSLIPDRVGLLANDAELNGSVQLLKKSEVQKVAECAAFVDTEIKKIHNLN